MNVAAVTTFMMISPRHNFAHHPLEQQTHGSMLGSVALRTVDAAHCCCRRHGVPRNLNVTAWQFRHPRRRAPCSTCFLRHFRKKKHSKNSKLPVDPRSMSPGHHSSILQDRRKSALGALDLSRPLAAPRGPPRHAARRPRSQLDASRRRWPRKRSGWPKERNGTGESQTTTDSAANKL